MSTTPTPEVDPLEAFALEARAAWSRRPAAERSLFEASLGDGVAMEDRDPVGLNHMIRRAALSGSVLPRDLVRGLPQHDAGRGADLPARLDAAHPALNPLADLCDRYVVDGEWRWTLKMGPRRRTLASLRESGRLQSALDEASTIPTDAAGDLLRVVAGDQLAASRSGPLAFAVPDDHASLQVAVQALAWAEPLAADLGGALETARRRLALATMRLQHGALIEAGFVGRTTHLKLLGRFATRRVADRQGVPVLPVVGVGGSGKSTLLSQLVAPLYEAGAAGRPVELLVVSIDFDRLQLRPGHETELSFEVTRQLAWFKPEAGRAFEAIRERTRRQMRSLNFAPGHSDALESVVKSSDIFEFDAAQVVRQHGLDKLPILLVLDTFEEWQRGSVEETHRPHTGRPAAAPGYGGGDAAWRALEWVLQLREQMELRNLRVLLSGRVPATAGPLGIDLHPPMKLDDLTPGLVTRLLRRHGVKGQMAWRLGKVVGGNPLALVLAARYFRRLSDQGRRQFLLDDGIDLTGLEAELRQGILYDRFLRHVDGSENKDVQKLAHPGLALRRVTADLIQHVLAQPCGLPNLDAAGAQALMRRLSQEVWLVVPGDGGLRHRADVRRTMLAMMVKDPILASKIPSIHQAAAAWYRSGHDTGLVGEAAEAEALYHELMLPDGAQLARQCAEDVTVGKQSPLTRLARWLADAPRDLEPAMAASVLFATGAQVPDAMASLLPPAVLEQWLERRGASLVTEGAPERAVALVKMQQAPLGRAPSWLPRAYVDQALWTELGPDLRAFFPSELATEAVAVVPANDIVRRGDLYRYIGAVLSDDGPLATDVLDSIEVSLGGDNRTTSRLQFGRQQIVRAYICSLWKVGFGVSGMTRMGRLGRDELFASAVPFMSNLPPGTDFSNADYLRRAVMMARHASGSDAIKLPAAVASDFFRPDPAWLRTVLQVCGVRGATPGSDLHHFIARVEALFQELGSPTLGGFVKTDPQLRKGTVSAVLATWSSEFARVLEINLDGGALSLRGPEADTLLRGANPEFRPAIRAVLRALDGAKLAAAIATLCKNLVPWLPSDLREDPFKEGMRRRPRETISRTVEYMDRLGLLSSFLDGVGEAFGWPARLKHLRGAFRRWDEANWTFVRGRPH